MKTSILFFPTLKNKLSNSNELINKSNSELVHKKILLMNSNIIEIDKWVIATDEISGAQLINYLNSYANSYANSVPNSVPNYTIISKNKLYFYHDKYGLFVSGLEEFAKYQTICTESPINKEILKVLNKLPPIGDFKKFHPQ